MRTRVHAPPVRHPRKLPPLKINIEEPAQVQWWCDHLRVTHEQLMGAIHKVGVDANSVRKLLGRQ